MAINTGNLDISQIRTVELSGGGNGAQLVSTTVSAKTAGDLAIWDANGNLIDAGSGAGVGVVTAVTASAPITSSGGINPNIALTTPLAVTYGGTGTAIPALVAGANISVSGTWPDQTIAVTGAGTVTSVGLSVPSIFSLSGTNPITGAGTFTLTLATESANTFLAAPSGSSGTPVFRLIAAADLPLATTGAFGAVKPDGTTVLVAAGTISVPTSTASVLGLVKPDGTSISISAGILSSVHNGTVTSVSLTMPSGSFTVAGSPVTGAGGFVVTETTQAAGLFKAGPLTGSAAVPTWRVIGASDLPLATPSSVGAMEPDGTTCSVSGGVLTVIGVGGGGAAFTLATTGSSGPATYSGGLLTIPTYSKNLVIGFVLNAVSVANNIGPLLSAPHAGIISKCKVVTKSSDSSVALTFRIMQNGVNVFSTNPTVSAGTAGSTVSTFTALTSSPLAVLADDVFSLDCTSGSSNWTVTVQLVT